jgi:hypothetical protein
MRNALHGQTPAHQGRQNGVSEFADAGPRVLRHLALSNGEVERRAVFAAPNEGTLSKTSTYQRASPSVPARPLQRLLEVTLTENHCARAAQRPQPDAT